MERLTGSKISELPVIVQDPPPIKKKRLNKPSPMKYTVQGHTNPKYYNSEFSQDVRKPILYARG